MVEWVGGGKGKGCVWVDLARNVEKVKCALVLISEQGAVRLFGDAVGRDPNDGTQGESDKAGKEVDINGCVWCEGGGCGGRGGGGGEENVEECGKGTVCLSGCGGEQEEKERYG